MWVWLRLYDLLSRTYWWPGITRDVKQYVSSCLPCQANKPSNQAPIGLLQPLPIPARRWEQVSMDLITQLPRTAAGHDAIVVFVDKLSKMVHFAPTTTTVSAPQLARLFFDSVVRQHGVPLSIVSDRDARFTSVFWRALWQQLGHSTGHEHCLPSTDRWTDRESQSYTGGHAASVCQLSTDRLGQASDRSRDRIQQQRASIDWLLSLLPQLWSASAPAPVCRSPTGKRVQQPTCGRTAGRPVRRPGVGPTQPDTGTAATSTLCQPAQTRGDIRSVGDEVLLSTANLRNEERAPKLAPKYIGPFPIKRVVSSVAYELELPDSMSRVHPVFHVSKLKALPRWYRLPSPTDSNCLSVPRPDVLPDTGEEAWEVERVVGKRRVRGRVQYLVLWKGYPDWERTWEPAGNLRHAAEAVRAYEEQQAA